MSELKPCPFCGGEAYLIKSGGNAFVDAKTVFARCSECQIDGESRVHHSDIDIATNEAIKTWNTRPNNHTNCIDKADLREQREACVAKFRLMLNASKIGRQYREHLWQQFDNAILAATIGEDK